MPTKKKSSDTEAVNTETENGQETTVYVATETRALTPEQAAHEAVENEPASHVVAPRGVEPVDFPHESDRHFTNDGYVVERINPETSSGLPIAVSADEDYKAALEDSSADYTAVKKERKRGEELKK